METGVKGVHRGGHQVVTGGTYAGGHADVRSLEDNQPDTTSCKAKAGSKSEWFTGWLSSSERTSGDHLVTTSISPFYTYFHLFPPI